MPREGRWAEELGSPASTADDSLPLPTPQDHLQDCLPPQPWAGHPQASLRLLPRLEEDRRAPQGLWSR